MPKDEEDEGQDGESIISQDIADWEGQTSNFLSQRVVKHGTALSYESALSVKNRNSLPRETPSYIEAPCEEAKENQP